MPLLLGEALDGRELEKETSSWTGERFANLCDSLVWASAGNARIPSTVSTVNAPDGGVDSECDLDIPAEWEMEQFFRPGWNVFQYKKRDPFASDRRKAINDLRSQLKGALAYVEKNRGKRPARYTLFVNIDLKAADKSSLEKAIFDGLSAVDAVSVVILGAQDIAQLLNNHPHVRAAHFQPNDFRTWSAAKNALEAFKSSGRKIPLFGRDDTLKRIRAQIADPGVKVLALWGPHDVGKSRLALDATDDRKDSVVVAADPEDLTPRDLRALAGPQREIICIAEDPDPRRVDALVREALTTPNLKLVLTVPMASHARRPSYGTDGRVQNLEVGGLSWDESRNLARAVWQDIPFGHADWIFKRSGGMPGIILAAATVGEALSEGALDFAAEVGKEYASRIETQFGRDGVIATRIISLMTYVGVSGEVAPESRLLLRLFGEGLDESKFDDLLIRLAESGIFRRRGSYAEISIPLLANYLTGSIVNGKHNETMALYAGLPSDTARVRMIRRLGQVHSSFTDWFWDAFLSEGKPLGSPELLEAAAGAAPEKMAAALKTLLDGMTTQQRQALNYSQRRGLIFGLEQLIYRKKTSFDGLRLMGLLAEDEIDGHNDAIGNFAECFMPDHPEMPLPLQDRLKILREFAQRTDGRKIVLKAVRDGIPSGGGSVSLHQVEGATPLDHRPAMTYQEMFDYLQALMELAWSISSQNDAVAAEGRSILPELATKLGYSGLAKHASDWLVRLTDSVVRDPSQFDASEVAGAIQRVLSVVEDRINRENLTAEYRGEWTQASETLKGLLKRLDETNINVRLRQWVGGRNSFIEGEDEGRALDRLADELIAQPSLLTPETWKWLISRDARSSTVFFATLGEKDASLLFRERLEEAGKSNESVDEFSSYWLGWAKRDYSAAKARLDELTKSDSITGRAVVLATWKISRGVQAEAEQEVLRIIDQLRRNRIEPDWVARIIVMGGWLKPLSSAQAAQLFREIAGPDFRNGSCIMDLIEMWLHLKKPLDGELETLAWEILEHDPPVKRNDAHDFDALAARLAANNPQRGIALLELLLATDRDGKWDPISRREHNQFWHALCSKEKDKALEVIMRGAANPRLAWRFEWALKGNLDPVKDKEALLALARQSVENARFLAAGLSANKQGFWSLASEFVALYPDDDKLWHKISEDLEGFNQVHYGPQSNFLDRRKQEVQTALKDSSVSAPLRRRLQEWLDRLEERIGQHVVWEYDEEIGDLRRYIADKNSSQRIWAIGRILKYASLPEIRRLLKVEDIEDALGQVDLPDKRKRALEAALPVWKNGQ